MGSIFTRILNGEIPCHKILEDEKYFAFLEMKPIHPGHTWSSPKQEVDYIFDLDDNLLGGLMVFAKKVAKAVQKVFPCQKIGIMVYGMEVRHAHVHLIPILGIPGELNFLNAQKATPEELASAAEKIRAGF